MPEAGRSLLAVALAFLTVPASAQHPGSSIPPQLPLREMGPAIMGGRVADLADAPSLVVTTAAGDTIRSLEADSTAGLHEVGWDLREEAPVEVAEEDDGGFFSFTPRGPLVLPGEYTVHLQAGDADGEATVAVRLDPRVEMNVAHLRPAPGDRAGLGAGPAPGRAAERVHHEPASGPLRAHERGRGEAAARRAGGDSRAAGGLRPRARGYMLIVYGNQAATASPPFRAGSKTH